MKRAHGCIFAVLVAVLACGTALAQTSPLYIVDGGSSQMWIVRNGTVQQTVPLSSNGFAALAVRDTVRLKDYNDGAAAEYTLTGTPTGATWPGGSVYSQLLDGTTDGQYNYTIAWNYGDSSGDPVLRYDLNWQNPTVLFNLPNTNHGIGITYDPTTGHLFIAYDYESVIREFTLAGQQVNSFDTQTNGRISGLAYEPATDSLWFKFNEGDTLYNFSKSGTQLNTIQVSGIGGDNDFGIEFAFAAPQRQSVPALSPWSLAALSLALAAIGFFALRR